MQIQDKEVLLQIACEILWDRYPQLDSSTIDSLAQQIASQPIEVCDQTPLRRAVGKRITRLIHAQFPDLIRKRQGRGKPIYVGPAPLKGRRGYKTDNSFDTDHNANNDPTDAQLSAYAFESANSPQNLDVQRSQERAGDLIDEAIAQASPANRNILLKLREDRGEDEPDEEAEEIEEADAAERRESLHVLARKCGVYPQQVKRALDQANNVLSGKAPRRPVARGAVNRTHPQGINYNPPTVSSELIMRSHGGAISSDIGRDLRTQPNGHNKRQGASQEDISSLPRPRRPQMVEHPQFGQGMVLRRRMTDSGECFDIEFKDGGRKSILRECLGPHP